MRTGPGRPSRRRAKWGERRRKRSLTLLGGPRSCRLVLRPRAVLVAVPDHRAHEARLEYRPLLRWFQAAGCRTTRGARGPSSSIHFANADIQFSTTVIGVDRASSVALATRK